MSCVNGAEMWVFGEKKSSFLWINLENPILGQLWQNNEKYS